MYKCVLTCGTFDLFHIGHLNLLKKAKSMGKRLVVGVSTDKMNQIKGKECMINYKERSKIVESIQYVDEVFPEQSLAEKQSYIDKYKADLFVIGNDWKGKFDHLKRCKVIYLPRTPDISTTQLKSQLNIIPQEQRVMNVLLSDFFGVKEIGNIGYNEICSYIPLKNNTNLFTTLTEVMSKIYFRILEKVGIKYFLFAGNAIDYLRYQKYGQYMPWLDDYDIIIFKPQYRKIPNITNELAKYGFKVNQIRKGSGGCQFKLKIPYPGAKRFQCDIFKSYVNKRGIVQNVGKWGLYHKKNVKVETVRPQKYLDYRGMKLPFFKKHKEDIYSEYPDVDIRAVLHLSHGRVKLDFKDYDPKCVYKAFNRIFEHVTKHNLEKYHCGYKPTNKSVVKMPLCETLEEFMKNIRENGITRILIMHDRNLLFTPDVKKYFPHIEISFKPSGCLAKNKEGIPVVILLNFVDYVITGRYSNLGLYEFTNKPKKIDEKTLLNRK